MHVLVDMDGTICDWGKQYDYDLDNYYLRYGSYMDLPQMADGIPRTKDQKAFNLKEGLSEKQGKIIDAVMGRAGFYAELDPIPGAIDALLSLVEDGHTVSIVSSPWWPNRTCVQDKHDWLVKHLGAEWADRLIITKDKTLVDGDILIDDKPEITGDITPRWEHILFDQPYNSHIVNGHRMLSWSEEEVDHAIEQHLDKKYPKLDSRVRLENVKDLPQFESFATGGPVSYGSGNYAYPLKPGEVTFNKEDVKTIGARILNKLNEEVRKTSSTGGQKGKKLAELGSLDPNSLLKVAEVAGFGSQKYDRLNYLKGYEWSLSFDAMTRHLLAFWGGEDRDEESKMLHLAHAAWHCLTLISYVERGLGTDDRYTSMAISQLQTKSPDTEQGESK